jgi:uncharacterized protein YhbP (UPF0306 family)
MAATSRGDLRERVGRYLRTHHTMTIATVGPPAGAAVAHGPAGSVSAAGTATASEGDVAPHAASVFYAVDDSLRLIFLSKPTSTHGLHIGATARVAATVTEHYEDWESIQGVQLWGTARRLSGAAKATAMAVYLRRFPFVRDLMDQPRLSDVVRTVAVYRVEPERAAFTDNTTGVFGREILELRQR